MAATVSLSLLARHIVSCTVYGGNPDASGNIVWGTGVDIASKAGTGAFDYINVAPVGRGTDLSGTDNPMEANVTEKVSLTASVRELQSSVGAAAIAVIADGADYMKAVCVYRPKNALSGANVYRAVIGRVASAPRAIGAGRNVIEVTLDTAGYPHVDGVTSLPSYFS